MRRGVKYILIAFCSFLLVSKLNAQEQIPVKIKCIDAETAITLYDVQLVINSSAHSNEKLKYADSIATMIPVSYGTASFELSLKKEGYHELDTLIKLPVSNRSIAKQKEQLVLLPMRYDGGTTAVVDVRDVYAPTIVFASDTFSVADFEIDHAGNMFLLTYSKRLSKGGMLVHYDYDRQKIIEKRTLNFGTIGFKRDYRGKLYLETEDKYYYILKTSRITLHTVEKAYFDEYIEPIVDTTEFELFFTNYSPWYPAFDYFGVSLKDTVYRDLAHIEDDEIMELYLAEYKYVDVRTKLWAWDMERSTGLDREVWVGAKNFVNSVYYEPSYGPMYKKNDTLYVFDHYKNYMYKVDPYNEFDKDSCVISYHLNPRQTGWKKKMLQDDVTKNIFNVYNNAGYFTLQEVNTDDGSLKNPLKLHHRYVEKIRVIGGEVYYIYRPFESTQKKYLYKEELTAEK